MAYSTISKPSLHFTTTTWSGSGSQQTISLPFQADWIWVKNRNDTANHAAQDIVNAFGNRLSPDRNVALGSEPNGIGTVSGSGFNFQGNYSGNGYNASGRTYVSWNWKAGGTGSANSDGDIASTVSANTTAGFSVVKWTANGSNNDTVGHGLGVAPKIVLYKRTDAADNWYLVYKFVDGTLDYVHLNLTNGKADLNLSTYGFTTSTTITNLGYGNTHPITAYCFAEKKGYSRFGSFTGNQNTDGTFIYTGFKPAWVMFKEIVGTSPDNWFMYDNKRSPTNQTQKYLRANLNNAEVDGSAGAIDILSNGFKLRTADTGLNENGGTYIYMAFAAEPLVANVGAGVPATAV